MGGPSSSTSAPAVSILVVTWRTPALVTQMVRSAIAAIDGLAGARGVGAEIIVVDNDPSDGTTARLVEEFGSDPRVEVIPNGTNTGFAAGNNLAVERSRGAVLIIANPDLELDEDIIVALYDRVVADPRAGLVTAVLVGPDGRAQRLHRSLPTLVTLAGDATRTGRRIDHRLLGGRIRRAHRMVDLPTGPVVSIGQAAGALVALRRTTLGALGGYLFDEALPILVNDVDLSRRVHDAGLEVLLLSEVRVAHLGSGSLSQLDERDVQLQYWDGMRAYWRRHQPRWSRAILRLLEPPAVRRHRRAQGASGRAGLEVDDDTWMTVVIISYQYGHLLAGAIDSALAQTWPHVEVIVVDDGSTDNTADVARAYADRGVQYVRKPNGGLSQARNVGARRSRGVATVFLDADDRLEPTMVERCVAALRADPAAALAYPGARLEFDEPGRPDEVVEAVPWDPERLTAGNYIFATHLVRTDVVRQFPYDEQNRVGWEDWDFLLALAEHGLHGVPVDGALLRYRRHATSMTHEMSRLQRLDQRRRVLRRHRRLAGSRRWGRAENRYWRTRFGLARRALIRDLRAIDRQERARARSHAATPDGEQRRSG